jgi:hypothetical protein
MGWRFGGKSSTNMLYKDFQPNEAFIGCDAKPRQMPLKNSRTCRNADQQYGESDDDL